MKVAITGASGLIGSALQASLHLDGHESVALVRRPARSNYEVQWDPTIGRGDDRLAHALDGVDAIVHLAGAGVGDRRWSDSYKQQIRESRTRGTTTIASVAAAMTHRPRCLVSASAIGFYGDTGDREVDETAPAGDGFLAEVVQAWEDAAAPAVAAGVRVVHPRSGLVVSGKGGAWGRLLPLFRIGLGGRMGNGQQYWSWVSLRDEVAVLRRMIDDDAMSGAYNVAAPAPATNSEITEVMGDVLGRPTFAHVPEFVLKTVLGEMSQEVLGSGRIVPSRLLEAGYEFLDPTFESAFRWAVQRPSKVA